jgi:hypothetical protein
MEKYRRAIIFLLLFLFPVLGQDLLKQKGAIGADSVKADSTRVDSVATAGKTDESFTNPYASESESASPVRDSSRKSDTAAASGTMNAVVLNVPPPVLADTGGSKKISLDLLMDLSLGLSLSRFEAKSPFYSSQGNYDVLFNIGIIALFTEKFYGELALRDFQLRYATSDSTADMMGSYFTTKAEEGLNFVSLSMNLGMKFEMGSVTPYFYVACESAFLTSSRQLVKRKSFTLFLPDSAAYTVSSVQDSKTTDKRTRFQVFAGVGAGMEINYGYGMVYIDGSARIALRETGYRDFGPAETASRLIVFPVSFGVRFYL